jgi:hypothetical protein
MAQKEYYIVYSSVFKNTKIRVKAMWIDVENFVTYLHMMGADDAYSEIDPYQGL